MPQLFRIGRFIIYFWPNEGMSEEPVHVHVAEGAPRPNATKIWITRKDKTLLANNYSRIKEKELRMIQRIIEANAEDIVEQWKQHFETLTFYC